MNKGKLTVLMPLYNKEAYIAESIESVLSQKTTFDFELIIIDDKSTDKSLKIANNYQKKYPQKIRLLINTKNEGCLSTTLKCYEHTKTEYFCVLDPDDYWISENKLQNAINFLDAHDDFTAYISNTYLEENGIKTPYLNILESSDFDFAQLTSAVWGHTSGVVFRNVIFKHGVPKGLYQHIGTKNEQCFEGDSFRNIIHLKEGKAHCVSDIESVYRVTKDGIWTSYNKFQQNTLNARFFLAMFSYFEAKPDFFIERCFSYCKENIRLVSLEQTSKEIVPANELLDFCKILSSCINHYNDLFSEVSDLYKCFIFYLPSRTVGGDEFLFMRLASFLADTLELEVYYVDYEDSIAKNEFSNTKVKFIKYCNPNTVIDLDKPANLIAPLTISCEIPKFKSSKIKLIFWCAHPYSIEWLQTHSSLKRKKITEFLLNLSKARSMCFMDWACWYANNTSGVPFQEIYVPVFTEEKLYVPLNNNEIHIIKKDEINIGWLGRLDTDKISSLINLLDNFYALNTNKKKNIHIIGEGDSKHLIDIEKYSQKINIIFKATLIKDDLYKYLLENVDVQFSMGISSLEAASLKIPSVLLFASPKRLDSNNFLWLFDSKNYTLGFYEEQKAKINITTNAFNQVIDEIYLNQKKQELGVKCYNYFTKNHHLTVTVIKLMSFILNSNESVRISEVSRIEKLLNIIQSNRFGRLFLRVLRFCFRPIKQIMSEL
jgi:glycosyltransferase involved in cell wall biosynthesis